MESYWLWFNERILVLEANPHDKAICCIGVLYFWEDYFVKILGCLKLMILYWLIFLVVDLQVDTNLESPDDFVTDGVPGIGSTYNVAPYSSILLEAKLWDDIRSYMLMKFSNSLFWSGCQLVREGRFRFHASRISLELKMWMKQCHGRNAGMH